MESSWSMVAALSFGPHGHCYLWRPDVLWLRVVSDTHIALAYYPIPVALLVYLRRRDDVFFHWMFDLFAAFIFACGTSHLSSVWIIWNTDYYLDGLLKAATAAVSMLTAVLLWPLIPRAVALPSPAQLQEKNIRLNAEIECRHQVESELRDDQQRLDRPIPIQMAEDHAH